MVQCPFCTSITIFNFLDLFCRTCIIQYVKLFNISYIIQFINVLIYVCNNNLMFYSKYFSCYIFKEHLNGYFLSILINKICRKFNNFHL